MPLSDYPNLDGDRANLIAMDVSQDILPESSWRVKYDREDLAFYKDMLKSIAEHKIKIVDIRE
jgi:hypothetical protein